MAEKYFLMPGVCISKEGLPGKKLECKKGKDPLELKPADVEVLKRNLGFLITQKKIVTASQLYEISEAEAKKKGESGKSEKRIELETEAESLEIKFNTKTSNKDLEILIEKKKGE